MALPKEIQSLVNEDKWQNAYNKASNLSRAVDNSYLIQVENASTGEEGFVKGTADNFTLVKFAKDGSVFTKEDAETTSKEIRSKIKELNRNAGVKQNKKDITSVYRKSDIVGELASQSSEKEEVINLFLDKIFKDKDIKESRETLIKIVKELGFSTKTNPLLEFANKFLNSSRLSHNVLSSEVINAVNDLYAEEVLSSAELNGKSPDKLSHIIFNENLYTNRRYEDVKFTVDAYKWLSRPEKIKTYLTNPRALKKYKIDDVNSISETRIKQIRNSIIYEDPSNVLSSEIKTTDEIEEGLVYLQSKKAADSYDNMTSRANTVAVGRRIKDEDKWKDLLDTSNINKETINAQQAQDLISYIAKEFKLV